jgi:peptidoglycan/LPS O-acetylase OafA/YrhL
VAALVHGLTVGGITLLIFAVVALAVMGGLRFLVNPVTLWLGAISYPLYLVHRLPGYAFLDWMNARHTPHLLAFAIALAGALAMGHVFSVAVERPSMRILRGWYRRTRAVAPSHSDAQSPDVSDRPRCNSRSSPARSRARGPRP